MNIDVGWKDQNESILLIVFHDGWTEIDFKQMIQQTYSLVSPKPNRVNIFVDFQDNFIVPQLVISIINNSKQHFSDNIGLVVIITPSLIIKYIYETVKPLLLLDYTIVFVDDFESADHMLHAYQTKADIVSK